MKSMTKNTQTKDTLYRMTANAFPLEKCTEITELTEGYFNVAYRISFESGHTCILKVAPPKEIQIMSYEKNIMFSEVTAMRIVAANSEVPIPKVLFYDDSCTLCTSAYFFMEELEGRSFSSMQKELSEEVKKQISIDKGRLNKQIHRITGEKFGYIGQPEMQGNNCFFVFSQMIQMAIADARHMSVDLKISTSQLETLLNLCKPVFEDVTVPRLVHWDLWNGNVFVKDNKITGLIDWERSLWADPLMEVGFRTYSNHEHFLTGYGIERLSESEYIRALWYDIYTLLLVAQECDYRMYETRDIYDWSTGFLVKKLDELQHAAEQNSLYF